MIYIFSILLALSQIIIFPLLSFRWAKEIILQVLIIISACSLIWNKNKWLASFILWSLFLFFLGKNLIINDYEYPITYRINGIALLNIINIVLIGIFYLVLHYIKLDKKIIYKTLCFVAVFQSVYIILQKFGIDQFFLHLTGTYGAVERWPVGTWANEAVCSWCIVLCSPFFLFFKDLRFKIGYFICFAALLCTKVTMGILGFILGFLFWLWHKSKKTTLVVILILLLMGGILNTNGRFNYYLQDTHRIKVWTKVIEIWKERPITGWGVGSFRTLFWERAPEFRTDGHWAQAHNEYLQVLFEEGIIGLGIILGLIFTTMLSFVRKQRGLIPLTCLVIASFISIFSFPLHTSQGAIIILALVLYERELWQVEEGIVSV